VRRNHESTSSPDAHSDHALVPTLDDVTGTERKDERLAAVPRRVELFAARHTDAHVVDDGTLAGGGFGARADDEVLDEELIRRGSEVGLDEGLFGHGTKY
jgi:hypothetical protein